MENCLVTKLVGVVDNDSLVKNGEICVSLNGPINTSFGIDAPASCPARISGDGYFSDSTYSQNLGKTATIAPNTNYYVVATGACKVFIKDDYILTRLTFNKGYTDSSMLISRPLTSIDVRLNDVLDKAGAFVNVTGFGCQDGVIDLIAFSGSSVLGALNLNGNVKAKGDIAAFANCPIKNVVNLNNCSGVYGNISSLGKCLLATNIPITNTQITGTIESLVEALYTNGKTSGNLILSGNGKVTFHSAIINNGGGGTAAFASGSVTVTIGSVTGTYNGSTWSYS